MTKSLPRPEQATIEPRISRGRASNPSERSSLRSRASAAIVVLMVVATVDVAGTQSVYGPIQLVGRNVSGTVASVTDGDTVHVRLDETGQTVTVRLEGIDCPEMREPFGDQARNATRVMLFDKRVELKGSDVDRYRRLVARVIVGGTDSSLELVRAGLACHFTRYSSDAKLASAEVDAKARGRGFWAPGAPKPACAVNEALAGGLVKRTGPLHGNRQSRLYHAASCKNYNCKNCTVSFQTTSDAVRAGYRPAADCLR